MTQTLLKTELSPELAGHRDRIKARAIESGLDFFEVIYEVLPFDAMNQIAAYGGFPVRYPHWRWGMEYDKLSKRDAYGMGRIYEMVINTDPCYAYLQESNAVTDQKLVMAHVYGHADFFKHNLWFSKTNRKMVDEMANHATRVRRHIEQHGLEPVERFLDACLSIEHLIDPHAMFMSRAPASASSNGADAKGDGFTPELLPAKDYMDRFINPPDEIERQREAYESQKQRGRPLLPPEPTRDALLFLLRHAPLAAWQQDILAIIRDEAYYFAPQAMTKVMNEGWATYWHSRLMTRHFVEASEIIDYADQHAGVVHMPPGGFNPYKIGLELFKDIEQRWDTGRHGRDWERLEGLGERDRFDDSSNRGLDKIFEVRRIYNDISFIDEFLTPEFVEERQMYQYKRNPATGEVRPVSRDFNQVKQTLLFQLTNMGQPFMYVVDANYRNRGELVLANKWTGLEVDVARAERVLRNLCLIWGRPTHLLARIDDQQRLFTCESPDDEKIASQRVNEETPTPAHALE